MAPSWMSHPTRVLTKEMQGPSRSPHQASPVATPECRGLRAGWGETTLPGWPESHQQKLPAVTDPAAGHPLPGGSCEPPLPRLLPLQEEGL